jgi:hypothetical protein
MNIGTAIVHRRTVSLPAHAFTARRQDRATLSGRRLARMSVGPVIEARRAASAVVAQPQRAQAHPVALECGPMPRQWPWTLASLLMIALIVAACACVSL